MQTIRFTLLCSAMVLSSATLLRAQQPESQPAQPPASATSLGDAWGHLKVLPPHAHMHVAADHGGATCYFIAVDEASLTCGRRDGRAKGQKVFPRAEVKSVKLTRYGVSTLGGLGIGAGVGTAIGFATTRHQNDFLDFSGVARAACAVIGGVGGAAIGGPTDMFRGPTIYRRIPPK